MENIRKASELMLLSLLLNVNMVGFWGPQIPNSNYPAVLQVVILKLHSTACCQTISAI